MTSQEKKNLLLRKKKAVKNKNAEMAKKTSEKSESSKLDVDKWRKGAEAAGGGGEFFKLKDGNNYIRLADDQFAHCRIHWIHDDEGNTTKINCLGSAGQKPSDVCPICKAERLGMGEIDTNHHYYFPIVVGKVVEVSGKKMIVYSPEVEILDCGVSVGGAICQFAAEILEDEDGEWAGLGIKNITQLNLKVVRTGKMLKTKYAVRHLGQIKGKLKGELGDIPDVEGLAAPPSQKDLKKAIQIIKGASSKEIEDEDESSEDWEDEEMPKKKRKEKPVEDSDGTDFDVEEDEEEETKWDVEDEDEEETTEDFTSELDEDEDDEESDDVSL